MHGPLNVKLVMYRVELNFKVLGYVYVV